MTEFNLGDKVKIVRKEAIFSGAGLGSLIPASVDLGAYDFDESRLPKRLTVFTISSEPFDMGAGENCYAVCNATKQLYVVSESSLKLAKSKTTEVLSSASPAPKWAIPDWINYEVHTGEDEKLTGAKVWSDTRGVCVDSDGYEHRPIIKLTVDVVDGGTSTVPNYRARCLTPLEQAEMLLVLDTAFNSVS